MNDKDRARRVVESWNPVTEDSDVLIDRIASAFAAQRVEYCEAFQTWANLYLKAEPDDYAAFSHVRIAVDKSNLLWRLIYGGEKVRTRPCPVHKGEWSGCILDPDKLCACACGSNLTGWLPDDDTGCTHQWNQGGVARLTGEVDSKGFPIARVLDPKGD